VDDAVAILLALASPDELEVRGITCVAGNVPLAQTQANARRVCELAGRTDIRVFAGCERPILRPRFGAKSSHGETGLGAAHLPDPAMPLQAQHAVDFLIESCLGAEEDGITLCPIGPLTNVALALVKQPKIVSRIREIILMGGAALNPGNVTSAAEFNIFVDPHAARIVFESGVNLTMFGLDATYQALVTPERMAAIDALPSAVASNVVAMLDFYGRYNIERFGGPGGPLHDPCVIANIIQPNLFAGKKVAVSIETKSELTMGETVADWWRVTNAKANCCVINEVDAEGFFALLTERLSRY
jgi:purine nucleosidase